MSAVIKSLPVSALSAEVDKLGALNASLKKLSEEADVIKAKLKLAGVPVVEGEKYKAVVSAKEVEKIDSEKVKAFYKSIGKKLPKKSSFVISVSLYDL